MAGLGVVKRLLERGASFLASVRTAIPLLVLIAAASIVGGLVPQGRNVKLSDDAPAWVARINDSLQLTDVFHAWWYVLLLALLGLSLLAVTVQRLPTIGRRRGRRVALAFVLAHAGVLLILGGMMYGGLSGFRYYTRLVEGEATVLPALPFVIKLDRFDLEHYPEETFRHLGPNVRLAQRQDSTLSLLHHGEAFLQATAAPGRPVVARGVTLLPSEKDTGWVFSLVVRDPAGREKVIPVRPWAPPLIRLGLSESRIFAHKATWNGVTGGEVKKAVTPTATEIVLLEEGGSRRSLGLASQANPLDVYGFTVSVWGVRRYTGLHVYRRPETPVLVAGAGLLVAGLLAYYVRWRRPVFGRRAGSSETAGATR